MMESVFLVPGMSLVAKNIALALATVCYGAMVAYPEMKKHKGDLPVFISVGSVAIGPHGWCC